MQKAEELYPWMNGGTLLWAPDVNMQEKRRKQKLLTEKCAVCWSYCNLINAKVKIVKLNLVKIIIESYSFYIIYLLIILKEVPLENYFILFLLLLLLIFYNFQPCY